MLTFLTRPHILLPAILTVMLIDQVGLAADPSKPDDPEQLPTVRVNVDGVTVQDYLDYINQSLPADRRAICTTAAQSVKLPTISGVKCRADIAVRLLEPITAKSAAPLKVTSLSTDDGQPQLIVVDLATATPKPTAAAISVKRALDTLSSRLVKQGKEDKVASSMARDQLTVAIKEGLAATFPTDAPRVTLKFHNLSGLLFLNGSPEQIEFIRQIISELEK